MSVLIEALTLVVPKQVLDVSYPGGTDAFGEQLLELENPPRFICNGDAHYLNASFYDPDHITPAVELLTDKGIVAADDGRFVELAIVDQRFGPTLPCDWLEWRTHKSGFTYAWRSGELAGDMAAPDGWTPAQSCALTRVDIREDRERMLRIASEGGTETWLDFNTGRFIEGPVDELVQPPSDDPRVGADRAKINDTPLLDVVRSVTRQWGWQSVPGPDGSLRFRIREARSSYDVLIYADEETGMVGCFCSVPARVPEERRVAIAEALCRINWKLGTGNFEMDFRDGEIRFRITVDVEGGTLAPRMVENLLGCAVSTTELYHGGLMRVAFGGADPATAANPERKSLFDE